MTNTNSWRRQLVIGLLPLTLGFEILAAVIFVPRALSGNADFRQFYAGGYMVRTGLRHSLYDPNLQRKIEDSAVSYSAQVLPVNHPSYEYVFFSAFSAVPYRQAYLLWGLTNLIVLAFCGVRIARWIGDKWLAIALVGGFAPVAATLMHGQDSLWLLLFCVLCADSPDEFRAGALLGLAAFRFHLLVPILILYVLWRKWRFVGAALLSAGTLATISVSIVGVKGSLLYLRTAASSTEVHQGFPVNAYGLAQAIAGPHHPRAALFMAGACAIASLCYASRQKPSLDLALLVIPLASYYLMLHDLVILLIPISRRIRVSSAAVLQFLIPVLGFSPLAFLAGAPSIFMLFADHSGNYDAGHQVSATESASA